jgi:hypothetical protein
MTLGRAGLALKKTTWNQPKLNHRQGFHDLLPRMSVDTLPHSRTTWSPAPARRGTASSAPAFKSRKLILIGSLMSRENPFSNGLCRGVFEVSHCEIQLAFANATN